MEALQYSRQLSKNPEEMMQLLWAVVAKDRKTRYPDLFNPVVWQQLELRLARVMSRSENYLSQMYDFYPLIIRPIHFILCCTYLVDEVNLTF